MLALPARLHVYLCSTGFEDVLSREIGAGDMRCPGVVAADPWGDWIFARQILPDAKLVEAPSIARLADGALALLGERCDRPFRLDVILLDDPIDPHLPGELARRASLLEQAIATRARAR